MSGKEKITPPYSPGPSERITPAYRPVQIKKTAPCQTGCPNCGDIRQWIGVVAQREQMGIDRGEAYGRAWRIITDVNPFPSCLGRICPHPCEQHCNRAELDESLAINAMERFLGDYAIEQGLELERIEGDHPEEWIGVVGAGPSGLSFAYQMARRGYRVTVYEEKSRPGGMLRYGVPEFRLPQSVLDAEINRILALGVELELGVRIGRDFSMDELRKRHAAIYVGLGAQMGRAMGIPGEQGSSVWVGADYLAAVNRGQAVELGSRVVVVGGGNSAMDAARCARRTGADVTVLYRRSREEMPAIESEVEDAEEEGINFELLATPVRVERSASGRLLGIIACRMELGAPDPSGRRRPVPVDGSEFRLPADSLITAISQLPVIDGFENLGSDGPFLHVHESHTEQDSVLAGGDVLGLGIAGNAIAQGRHAAEQLHLELQGRKSDEPMNISTSAIGPERVKFESRPGSAAVRPGRLPVAERLKSVATEVTGRISESDFLSEVERCFSCGSCLGCEQCTMYCTRGCFTRLDEVEPGRYFTLALDECLECGKCIEVCPSGFLEVV